MRSSHIFAPPVLATAMAGPEQDPPVEVVEEPEPESGKPKVDLAGFASELEQLESVRTHLRETKGPLFDPDENPESIRRVEKDHAYDIMKLATLYQNCSVVTDDSTVHTDAWFVRKIVSFVKMKVRRAKVSTVTHLK